MAEQTIFITNLRFISHALKQHSHTDSRFFELHRSVVWFSSHNQNTIILNLYIY